VCRWPHNDDDISVLAFAESTTKVGVKRTDSNTKVLSECSTTEVVRDALYEGLA
jgi:hypothetical protein